MREEDKETVTNAITEESQEENLTEFNEWGRSIRRNAKYMYKVSDRGVCVCVSHYVFGVWFVAEFSKQRKNDLGVQTDI